MAPRRKNAATSTAAAPAPAAPAAPASIPPALTDSTAASTANDVSATPVPVTLSTPPATVTATPSPARQPKRNREGMQTMWQAMQQLATDLQQRYVNETPQPTRLIDVFLAFLVVIGVVQFAYCVLAGNYPFNAFLAGFSAAVGQFVLTVSLRIQTLATYKDEFPKISPERAFADFIICSVILHFFCISYIN